MRQTPRTLAISAALNCHGVPSIVTKHVNLIRNVLHLVYSLSICMGSASAAHAKGEDERF
jgi:hypothetical protein